MICSYQSARDLFGAARDASLEMTRTMLQLEAMEARRHIKGQGYSGMPHGQRADVNCTAASIALIDREEMLRSRIRDDEELLDLACQVAYGADGRGGGVSALLGSVYADVLFWRYCAGESWDTVARECGQSKRTALRYAEVALDAIDAYGLGRMVSGEGMAEE